jgi:ParB family chromosome partitioning protein
LDSLLPRSKPWPSDAFLKSDAPLSPDISSSVVVPIRKDDVAARLIPLDAIEPNPDQPRKAFAAEAIKTLAESIRKNGLLQPILVHEVKPGRYRIIAGERRWKASREAGLNEIPAVIRKADRTDELALALIENLQREDLNPVEEARAFQRLSNEYELSHDVIATRVGRSRAGVSNAIRLLSLSPEILDALETGAISAGQARPLVALGKAAALALFERILAKKLSAREVERLAAEAVDGPSDERKAEKGKAERTRGSIARADAEDRMMKKLGRGVKIVGDDQKGFLKIEYYSKDDLINLVELILEH